jgi:hypothetical protein
MATSLESCREWWAEFERDRSPAAPQHDLPRTPPPWSIPREWPGERCFVILSGESVQHQRHLIPKLKGRFIVIREAVRLRPDADVLLALGGLDIHVQSLLPFFKGRYVIVRRGQAGSFPPWVKNIREGGRRNRFSNDHSKVCGTHSCPSAMNVAIHFGATEIIMLGMDMQGTRWCKGPHPFPVSSRSGFFQQMHVLPHLAEDAKRKGVRIVNCSPTSRVTCFERQPLEAFV